MKHDRVHILEPRPWKWTLKGRFASLLTGLTLPIAVLLGSGAAAEIRSTPEAAVVAAAVEPSAGQEAPETAETDEPSSAAAESPVFELWDRLETLREGIATGEKSPVDADAFYQELMPILEARRQEFREALSWARSPGDLLQLGPEQAAPVTAPEGAPVEVEPATEAAGVRPLPGPETVQDLYDTLAALYDIRLQLREDLTPAFRRRVMGVGLTGIREFRGEIETATLRLRFVPLLVRKGLAYWQARLALFPLLLIGGVFELVLVVLIFRWWRRSGAKALLKWFGRLLEARPPTQRKLRLARFLWYLDRVRSPLEWLLLATVIFAIIDLRNVPGFENLIWPLPRWILLTWFLLALLDAIASRGGAGNLGDQASTLRLRSFRLLAAWFVLLGFSLELARVYTGQGTFHAWVWGLFGFLVLPVVLLLVVWWRPEIFRLLDSEPQQPEWVQREMQRRSGPMSYWSAAVCGVYLIILRLTQRILRTLSKVDQGKRLLASLSRRGAESETAGQGQNDRGEPISAELRTCLLEGDGKVYEKAARAELAQLVELVESGRSGLAAVVAEQGGGKSLLLRRLSSKCDGKVLVFDCPPGGYEAFVRAFAAALGMSEEQASPAAFAERLEEAGTRVVAIDNLHRLIRPVMGGLKDLDRVSEFIEDITVPLLWVIALNQAPWDYISRLLVHRLVLDSLLELPPWTEEQIGDLIDLRCDEAGIKPDFGRLVFPNQLYDAEQDTPEERNRSTIFRIIWDASGGNPWVAMALWLDSLAVTEDGTIAVCLPPEPASRAFEGINFTVLLVLRVIIRSEMATREDIVESLRLSEAEVGLAIRFVQAHGWIEELDGRYRLSWKWFRPITRVLARQYLMFR